MEKKHVLLYGERGVGKSTMIEKLLQICTVPVYGFVTKATPRRADGYHSIYIYPAGSQKRFMSAENHVGDCNGRQRTVNGQVFDSLGVSYLLQANADGILVMDELGFMEKDSAAFCQAVLNCLEQDIPVLAAVKNRQDIDFLKQVCQHPKAQLYRITQENREAVYRELVPVMQKWNQRQTGDKSRTYL